MSDTGRAGEAGYVVVNNRCEPYDESIFETIVEASLEACFLNIHERERGPWHAMAIAAKGARA